MAASKPDAIAHRFVQIHALISYPPSNPNRDDLGRPKTALFGGTPRQRISSQALKRAWRLGEPFAELEASLSTRTRRLGLIARDRLLEHKVSEKKATEWAHAIAAEFGSVSKKELESEEIVILGPEELAAVYALIDVLAKKDRGPEADELKALERPTTALDVAMFGRMRADAKEVNMDASVQVAHAITTNQVRVEADYWTAVDDLNAAGDSGAGGIGEREFGSGVYYVYACVDVPALKENLEGNVELARKGLGALVRSVATIGPGGHRNSFANRVYAQYLRVEVGDQQPRTLAAAFEKAINPRDGGLTEASIRAIDEHAEALDRAYGQLFSETATLDVPGKRGSLDEVLATAAKSIV